ncbi:MAG: ATP-binding cassette domain-containing protein [Crocinitomicaceae bacterium]
MKIVFDHIIPEPLKEYPHAAESLWNNKHVIENGQKVLINAASGKGKTTVTHLLAGLRHDYQGELSFDSAATHALSVSDWLEIRQTKFSFVFQDLQLFPTLSSEENLLINTRLKGGMPIEKLKEWAAYLGIETKWKTPSGIMSMGQQQRLAILRALSQPFETIVMDEPFSHLDEHNTRLAISLIEERCKELSAGLILTTLDPTDKINVDKEIKL